MAKYKNRKGKSQNDSVDMFSTSEYYTGLIDSLQAEIDLHLNNYIELKRLFDVLSKERDNYKRAFEQSKEKYESLKESFDLLGIITKDISEKYKLSMNMITWMMKTLNVNNITIKEITNSILCLPATVAFAAFTELNLVFISNENWQKAAPGIKQKIIEKMGNEQRELLEEIVKASGNTTMNIAGNISIKNETNIDKNYGPNIEQRGGDLYLPEKNED